LPSAALPTELVDLAAAFNGMLARLEDSFRRLSEFSSDLAHELRTPVSSLMTQTHVALSRTRWADEYREVPYSNSKAHERLARMIADMLFLAKSDHGLIVPRWEPVQQAGRRVLVGKDAGVRGPSGLHPEQRQQPVLAGSEGSRPFLHDLRARGRAGEVAAVRAAAQEIRVRDDATLTDL
jgi:hypothetical protein